MKLLGKLDSTISLAGGEAGTGFDGTRHAKAPGANQTADEAG